MHFHGDERHHLLAIHLVQLAAGQHHELGQVGHPLLLQLPHGALSRVRVAKRLLALRGPHDAPGRDDHLPRELLDPLLLLHPLGLLQGLVQGLLARGVHGRLELVEPVLGPPVGVHLVVEEKRLAVGGVHSGGAVVAAAIGSGLVHLELLDTLKHSFEVGLDVEGILGLSQDLQQIVRGDKVETRKLLALLLQVVFQRLLNLFQLVVHVGELVEHGVGHRGASLGLTPRAGDHHVVEPLDLFHRFDEREVNVVEHDGLLRELLADVLRTHKDILEIHPRHLHLLDNLHHF
mmetsp:Transcript_4038/g.6305  ORF Transcript_4038/g.6305 Transcript_4038/m.6305 type:complete len:290 (+) Transcript_4038:8361-9230(+)